jgi:hypothetical protein
MSINMECTTDHYDPLLRSGARRLTGHQRRLFQAEVATELCGGSARLAERRFGWARETVEKGLHESHHGMRCLENFSARGRQRSEDKNPQLAADIRAIVEPHTYADPELQSSRRYTNLSAAEVRDALIARGHSKAELPSERTLRDILNRMNYRLKRIQKGKPLKKTERLRIIRHLYSKWIAAYGRKALNSSSVKCALNKTSEHRCGIILSLSVKALPSGHPIE